MPSPYKPSDVVTITQVSADPPRGRAATADEPSKQTFMPQVLETAPPVVLLSNPTPGDGPT